SSRPAAREVSASSIETPAGSVRALAQFNNRPHPGFSEREQVVAESRPTRLQPCHQPCFGRSVLTRRLLSSLTDVSARLAPPHARPDRDRARGASREKELWRGAGARAG